MLDLLPIAISVAKDVSPGRLIESMVILFFLWKGVSKHLMKIEKRLEGLENALREGFSKGETRFQKIEDEVKEIKGRITILEKTV